MLATVPTLAVSIIFCLYDLARRAGLQRQRRLRERVTYMLWVMAHQDETREGNSFSAP
jgi:hypothetical protein